MTIRQQIISLLEGGPIGFRELAKRLRIGEKDLADHLSHISRSMKSQSRRLVARPFFCMACGFAFKERKHFAKPGRCPKCKSTHVEEPVYIIE